MKEFFVELTVNGATSVGLDRFNEEDGLKEVERLRASLESAGFYNAFVRIVSADKEYHNG